MNVPQPVYRKISLPLVLLLSFFAAAPLTATAAPVCPATIKGPAAVSAGSGVPNGGATWWTDGNLVSTHVNAGGDITLCRYAGSKVTTTPSYTISEPYKFDKIVRSLTAVLSRPTLSYVVRFHRRSDLMFMCNGVAITPDWILTTRHCVQSGELADGFVFGGGVIFELPDEIKQIDRIDMNTKTDLAMVHVSSPMVLMAYGRVAQSLSSTGTMYTWMCWSETDDRSACLLGDSSLRSNDVINITDSSDCQANARAAYRIDLTYLRPNNALCGKGRSTFVHGDEGAPLVTDNRTILGISSATGEFTGRYPKTTIFGIQVGWSYWTYNDGFFVNLTWPDNSNWIAQYQGMWSTNPGW